MSKTSVVMNLMNHAISQYDGWKFNSFFSVGSDFYGANENGVFLLNGHDFAGVPIQAKVTLWASDFGIPNQKRIRYLILNYVSSGNLKVTFYDDQTNPRIYTCIVPVTSLLEHSAKMLGGRLGKGRNWTIVLENVNGAEFAVDDIRAALMILAAKPSRYFHGNYGEVGEDKSIPSSAEGTE